MYSPSESEAKEAVEALLYVFAPLVGEELGIGHVHMLADGDSFGVFRRFGEVKITGHVFADYRMICIEKVSIYYRTFSLFSYEDKHSFYQKVLFSIAHELRHVYQLVTGIYFDKQRFDYTYFSLDFRLPYRLRWSEVDANKWAHWFVSGRQGDYLEVPDDYQVSDYQARAVIHSLGIKQYHMKKENV